MRLADLLGESRRRRRYPRQTTIWTYVAPVALIVCVVIVVIVVHDAISHSPTLTQPTTPLTAATTATLPISHKREYHRVKTGETLSQIAIDYHTTVAAIQALNRGIDAFNIRPGQRIRVH